MPTCTADHLGEFPELTELQCGALRVLIHEGSVRGVEYKSVEVLRGVYFTVRDDHWREVPPERIATEVRHEPNAFCIDILQHYSAPSVSLKCRIRIQGDAAGMLSYTVHAEPTGKCLTNRLGLCVLHGSQVSGKPLRVTTVDGGTVVGEFPGYVFPHQPFTDIRSLQWCPVEVIEAKLRLTGDAFEMEDQRNWSDDSFKTYCTPLRFPKPVLRSEGNCVTQQANLKIHVFDNVPVKTTIPPSQQISVVAVTNQVRCRLPLIGMTWPQEKWAFLEEGIGNLFAHIWVRLDLRDPNWREALLEHLQDVEQRDGRVVLEVDGSESERTLCDFFRIIQSCPAVLTVMLFSRNGVVTDAQTLNVAKEMLSRHAWSIELSGGTRGHYAQLNRSQVHRQNVDAVLFAVTPTVHMSDLLSIRETLNAQRQLVADVRRYMERTTPVHVGPITVTPRFNADFPIDESNPIVDNSNPLYGTAFYAGWLIGSINALSRTDVQSVTYSYHSMLGLRGSAVATTASRVLDQIKPSNLQYVLYIETSDDALQCLALQHTNQDDVRLFVSNLSGESRTVQIRLPKGAEAKEVIPLERQVGRIELRENNSLVYANLSPCSIAVVQARFRS